MNFPLKHVCPLNLQLYEQLFLGNGGSSVAFPTPFPNMAQACSMGLTPDCVLAILFEYGLYGYCGNPE